MKRRIILYWCIILRKISVINSILIILLIEHKQGQSIIFNLALHKSTWMSTWHNFKVLFPNSGTLAQQKFLQFDTLSLWLHPKTKCTLFSVVKNYASLVDAIKIYNIKTIHEKTSMWHHTSPHAFFLNAFFSVIKHLLTAKVVLKYCARAIR